ncbi:MAG: FprA family A-type flavoprotein [Planctomycetota bacterium]|jgi:flavorubredoxin
MESSIKVVDQIYWVGMNDRESPLFESIWPLPNGVSYNSYLILDRKVALIDTVKKISTPDYIVQLKRLLRAGRQIDYLVVHHLEPDHSGAIRMLLEMFPQLRIFGTRKAAEFLKNLYDITDNVSTVTDGDELDLGQRKLKFVTTPMVHWPETMMSYESQNKILFSGDAFGGFGTLDGGIFDDTVDIEYYESEILRYFSNIVGKFSPMVQKAIAKLQGLDIGIVASTHGPIWRSRPERIIELYDRWSRHDPEEGVVVAYGSMYGNTEKMMEHVVRGITQEGLHTVRVHDVAKSHISFVIRDVWQYKGLILGSPTYDAKLLPQMESLVALLADKKIQNRCAGVFGSCGWSGGGVKSLEEFVRQANLELLEPVIEARFAADDDQLKQCIDLGRKVASTVLGSTAR